MTILNRSPFENADLGSEDQNCAGDKKWVLEETFFVMSLEAYTLALHSNTRFPVQDLFLSGTWQKYEQRAAAIARKHPSLDPFISYLAIDAKGGWQTANSRQSYRSALVRMAALHVQEYAPTMWRQMIADAKSDAHRNHLIGSLSGKLDEYARACMSDPTSQISDRSLRLLTNAVTFLLTVPPDPHHIALRDHGNDGKMSPARKKRSKATKRDALVALNQHQRRTEKAWPNYDWRSHFWETSVIADQYLDNHRRACIAALMLTGCRPAEFSDELGVTVSSLLKNQKACLHFSILGAKVSDGGVDHLGKGQVWREIELDCETVEAIWLSNYVSELPDRSTTLMLEAAANSHTGEVLSPTERRRRISVAVGKLLTRLGQFAFPRLRHRLTAYVFRHAISSDFKVTGHSDGEGELAALLGHQSSRTQEHYGAATSARGLKGNRTHQITAVRSSTPIRQPARPGFTSSQPSQVLTTETDSSTRETKSR
jgi:hypothetical protein